MWPRENSNSKTWTQGKIRTETGKEQDGSTPNSKRKCDPRFPLFPQNTSVVPPLKLFYVAKPALLSLNRNNLDPKRLILNHLCPACQSACFGSMGPQSHRGSSSLLLQSQDPSRAGSCGHTGQFPRVWGGGSVHFPQALPRTRLLDLRCSFHGFGFPVLLAFVIWSQCHSQHRKAQKFLNGGVTVSIAGQLLSAYSRVLHRRPRLGSKLFKQICIFISYPVQKQLVLLGCTRIRREEGTHCGVNIGAWRSLRRDTQWLHWLQRCSLPAKLMYVMFFSPFTMVIYC